MASLIRHFVNEVTNTYLTFDDEARPNLVNMVCLHLRRRRVHGDGGCKTINRTAPPAFTRRVCVYVCTASTEFVLANETCIPIYVRDAFCGHSRIRFAVAVSDIATAEAAPRSVGHAVSSLPEGSSYPPTPVALRPVSRNTCCFRLFRPLFLSWHRSPCSIRFPIRRHYSVP